MTDYDKRLGVWTDELVEKLRDLYQEQKLSFGRIAAELGLGLTKNAVMGKVHRLGWIRRGSPREKKERVARPKRPTRNHSSIFKAIAEKKFKALKSEPIVRVVHNVDVPKPLHILFGQLGPDTCKFECSGSDDVRDFTFCGCAPAPGRPYCEAHCRVAFTPPKPRKPSTYIHRGRAA